MPAGWWKSSAWTGWDSHAWRAIADGKDDSVADSSRLDKSARRGLPARCPRGFGRCTAPPPRIYAEEGSHRDGRVAAHGGPIFIGQVAMWHWQMSGRRFSTECTWMRLRTTPGRLEMCRSMAAIAEWLVV
jgi:hypothetical protein